MLFSKDYLAELVDYRVEELCHPGILKWQAGASQLARISHRAASGECNIKGNSNYDWQSKHSVLSDYAYPGPVWFSRAWTGFSLKW
jgi:hypothetical protein